MENIFLPDSPYYAAYQRWIDNDGPRKAEEAEANWFRSEELMALRPQTDHVEKKDKGAASFRDHFQMVVKIGKGQTEVGEFLHGMGLRRVEEIFDVSQGFGRERYVGRVWVNRWYGSLVEGSGEFILATDLLRHIEKIQFAPLTMTVRDPNRRVIERLNIVRISKEIIGKGKLEVVRV